MFDCLPSIFTQERHTRRFNDVLATFLDHQTFSVALLSMKGQKALGFHQKSIFWSNQCKYNKNMTKRMYDNIFCKPIANISIKVFSKSNLQYLFYTMEVNGYSQLFSYQHSSKYLILCSTAERNSYRFGTTSG